MAEETTSPEETKDYAKQAKQAWVLGGSIMVFAGITTLICSLPGSTHSHIVWALFIASAQVFIQVFYMMHLRNERGIIFKFLVFTLFFVMALFVLTHLHESDPLHYKPLLPSD
jgi:4-amino-4-deoxy-L-arabinose transferase-like glycosyltransferase